ncbi:MAG TPA: hypothetical protein VJN44_06710, partial [Roseateles sp.]|nr:hypothetical protein [Roseateles sp.]
KEPDFLLSARCLQAKLIERRGRASLLRLPLGHGMELAAQAWVQLLPLWLRGELPQRVRLPLDAPSCGGL